MTDTTGQLISDNTYLQELLPTLSQPTRLLWGKTLRDNTDKWLPLYVHLSDTVATAELIWEHWIPASTKQVLARAIIKADSSLDEQTALHEAKKLFLACAAVHDVGKATPVFQLKASYTNPAVFDYVKNSGLRFSTMASREKIPHALASQAIVERHGWIRNISVVLGGHHGKPPSRDMLMEIGDFSPNTGFADPSWLTVQDELLEYAMSLICLDLDDALFNLEIDTTAQVILTGLLILSDWIASNENHFPYLGIPVLPNTLRGPRCRAKAGWDDLEWSPPWQAADETAQPDFFTKRFGFSPRPCQESVMDVLTQAEQPGLIVIEAPMGEGKTEAALAAAEIMAAKTGCGGLFVALPTQATSDGLLPRILEWMDKLNQPVAQSVNLVHGKSQFNAEYQALPHSNQVGEDSEADSHLAAAIINDWFCGRKRGILANFVVGTIDQILMGGLKQKHLALRHLALANKVVIIDECHAYDAYMSSYLYKVLAWLGAYQVPTIVLSATLPNTKRMELVDSYLGERLSSKTPGIAWLDVPATQAALPEWADTTAYPLITYTDKKDVVQCKPEQSSRSLHVDIQRLDDDMLIPELEMLLADGGCAGIVVNTVSRAQSIALQFSEYFGTSHVELFHSQFIAPARIEKEKDLRDQLGPPEENDTRLGKKLLIVGTQVLEQSLDIDFDVLFTDICPMDSLIQRMGRLHRHAGRIRPAALLEARCYVMGTTADNQFDKGSKSVYGGEYLLMNTDILLPTAMTLPDDISPMVQQAYSPEGLETLSKCPAEYRKAQAIFQEKIACQQDKASKFQISGPNEGASTLVGWLDTDVDDASGKRGEATVRDSSDSIEVLVVQQRSDGNIYLLPGVDKEMEDTAFPQDSAPPPELAWTVARCSVRLPTRFCTLWNIDTTIHELESSNLKILKAWQDSEWLQGELFLVLDDEYRTELCGQVLHYSEESGLSLEKRGDDH